MFDTRNIKKFSTILEETRQIVSKELRSLPAGKLYILHSNGYVTFYQIYRDKDGKRVKKGIGKNKKLLAKLARKYYLQEELKIIDYNLDVLKKCDTTLKELDVDDVFRAIPEKYRILPKDYYILPNSWAGNKRKGANPTNDERVSPLWCPKRLEGDREAFRLQRYRQNGLYTEKKVVPTRLGFKVRSKSEAMIVDIYDRLDIDEHYDQLIQLIDDGWISPDFIFRRRDGSLVLHEHFGRMTDPEYVLHIAEKLRRYEASGYHLWDNLIFTYDAEDGSIDAEYIEATIKHYYNMK